MCEQLAQGRYLRESWPGAEPATQRPNRYTRQATEAGNVTHKETVRLSTEDT